MNGQGEDASEYLAFMRFADLVLLPCRFDGAYTDDTGTIRT